MFLDFRPHLLRLSANPPEAPRHRKRFTKPRNRRPPESGQQAMLPFIARSALRQNISSTCGTFGVA